MLFDKAHLQKGIGKLWICGHMSTNRIMVMVVLDTVGVYEIRGFVEALLDVLTLVCKFLRCLFIFGETLGVHRETYVSWAQWTGKGLILGALNPKP